MVNSKGSGILLTSTEHKLIDCICLLLHEKSQNNTDPKRKDPKSKDFYAGNPDPGDELTQFEGVVAPHLYVTIHEVARLFNGGDAPGGDVSKTVREALEGLAHNKDKKALFVYKRRVERKGQAETLTIRDYNALLKIPDFDLTMDTGENTKQTLIILHPIFRDQIEKYLHFSL